MCLAASQLKSPPSDDLDLAAHTEEELMRRFASCECADFGQRCKLCDARFWELRFRLQIKDELGRQVPRKNWLKTRLKAHGYCHKVIVAYRLNVKEIVNTTWAWVAVNRKLWLTSGFRNRQKDFRKWIFGQARNEVARMRRFIVSRGIVGLPKKVSVDLLGDRDVSSDGQQTSGTDSDRRGRDVSDSDACVAAEPACTEPLFELGIVNLIEGWARKPLLKAIWLHFRDGFTWSAAAKAVGMRLTTLASQRDRLYRRVREHLSTSAVEEPPVRKKESKTPFFQQETAATDDRCPHWCFSHFAEKAVALNGQLVDCPCRLVFAKQCALCYEKTRILQRVPYSNENGLREKNARCRHGLARGCLVCSVVMGSAKVQPRPSGHDTHFAAGSVSKFRRHERQVDRLIDICGGDSIDREILELIDGGVEFDQIFEKVNEVPELVHQRIVGIRKRARVAGYYVPPLSGPSAVTKTDEASSSVRIDNAHDIDPPHRMGDWWPIPAARREQLAKLYALHPSTVAPDDLSATAVMVSANAAVAQASILKMRTENFLAIVRNLRRASNSTN